MQVPGSELAWTVQPIDAAEAMEDRSIGFDRACSLSERTAGVLTTRTTSQLPTAMRDAVSASIVSGYNDF